MRDRGKLLTSELAPRVVATVHPSSVLRAEGDDSRRAAMAAFVGDLKRVARVLAERRAGDPRPSVRRRAVRVAGEPVGAGPRRGTQ